MKRATGPAHGGKMADIGCRADDGVGAERLDQFQLSLNAVGCDRKHGEAVVLQPVKLDTAAAQHRYAVAKKDRVAPFQAGPPVKIPADGVAAPALGMGRG